MPTPKLTRRQVLDLQFIEHRAKMLDIAAFLDRIERSPADGPVDPRVTALEAAARLLTDGKPERARRILELMSDPTPEPIAKAGTKGAIGVWPGAAKEPA